MDLNGIILSKKRKGLVLKVTYSMIPFIQNSLNDKMVEMENRPAVARG